jgi:hypothetical protein
MCVVRERVVVTVEEGDRREGGGVLFFSRSVITKRKTPASGVK